MNTQGLIIAVERLILAVVGLAMIFMIVHVSADVLGKNLFGRPLPGTIAIVSNYYMPIVTFLPLILVQHYNQHISVDVLFNRFPTLVQKHVAGLTFLFSAVIFALLAYYGWIEAITKYRSGVFIIESRVPVLTWPGYFMPAVGYGMISLYLFAQFLGYATGTGKPPESDAGPAAPPDNH